MLGRGATDLYRRGRMFLLEADDEVRSHEASGAQRARTVSFQIDPEAGGDGRCRRQRAQALVGAHAVGADVDCGLARVPLEERGSQRAARPVAGTDERDPEQRPYGPRRGRPRRRKMPSTRSAAPTSTTLSSESPVNGSVAPWPGV